MKYYIKDGKTALLVACSLGNMDIVKLLIEKNANVFEKDCVYTASNNFVDLVKYLIEVGVDPNETDKVFVAAVVLCFSRVETLFILLASTAVMRRSNIYCTISL